eukprot:Gb_30439 [translate_table: standard]
MAEMGEWNLSTRVPEPLWGMALQGPGLSGGGQFGDTTYTKVFVGGLAWETKRETMRRYFEQFGEILEAVVITDKNTGRSKGYGFVTFREAEAARRACVDAAPIIDGRRANCNLASLGAHRSRPSTPQHGNRFRLMSSSFQTGFQTGGPGYMAGAAAFPQPTPYAIQQGFPYHTYGYSPYSSDYTYPPSYYSPYGGTQFPLYASPGMISSPAVYPYFQFTQSLQGSPGYPHSYGHVQAVPHIMQYPAPAAATISSLPQQYGGIISIPTAVQPTGMTVALPTGAVASAQHYQIHSSIQPQYSTVPGGAASEQPSA